MVCLCREGNDPGQERTVTYKEMLDITCQVGRDRGTSESCQRQPQSG